MTLHFSPSDTSICDNLSRTIPQFADSRQIQKNNSSADNLSLRFTVAPSLTAFLKTIYNKVAGQSLPRFIVARAQTAMQVIRMTTPAIINITPQMQKSHTTFLFLNYRVWHICTCSISRKKTCRFTKNAYL